MSQHLSVTDKMVKWWLEDLEKKVKYLEYLATNESPEVAYKKNKEWDVAYKKNKEWEVPLVEEVEKLEKQMTDKGFTTDELKKNKERIGYLKMLILLDTIKDKIIAWFYDLSKNCYDLIPLFKKKSEIIQFCIIYYDDFAPELLQLVLNGGLRSAEINNYVTDGKETEKIDTYFFDIQECLSNLLNNFIDNKYRKWQDRPFADDIIDTVVELIQTVHFIKNRPYIDRGTCHMITESEASDKFDSFINEIVVEDIFKVIYITNEDTSQWWREFRERYEVVRRLEYLKDCVANLTSPPTF